MMLREPSLHFDRVKHNSGKLQNLVRAGFSRGRGNTQLDEVKGGGGGKNLTHGCCTEGGGEVVEQ